MIGDFIPAVLLVADVLSCLVISSGSFEGGILLFKFSRSPGAVYRLETLRVWRG
jgi:hypothetical protein